MSSLTRALRRWNPPRVAAAGLGVCLALLLAAYVVGLTGSQATASGVASALALVAIAGAGLLYAWRLGAGGPVE